ncbi:MAG: OstA-like protein [Lishizhenia sp.]
MKGYKNILQIALSLSAIFLSSISWAQEGFDQYLKHADLARYDALGNSWILEGNVEFDHLGNRMFCDSAIYFISKRTFKAYSKVHVSKRDTLNLFCDSIHYDLAKEYAKLYGNVRVRDREFKLTTDTLEYDARRGAGIYRNGATITSILTNEVLTSKIGYFFPDSKNFTFSKNVVYASKDYKVTTDTLRFNGYSKQAYFYGPTDIVGNGISMYCEKGWYSAQKEEGVLQQNAHIYQLSNYIKADSLYYNKRLGISEGKGNVVIKDTLKKAEFYGDFARSNEKEQYAFLTGKAYALTYDKGDSLFIHADSLWNFSDSSEQSKLILAYNDVKIFKKDIQGSCDSLAYNQQDSLMTLFHNPIIWADKAQLTGDTLKVHQTTKGIEKIDVLQNAIVVTEVDSSEYYNQVGSKTMIAYFKNDTISHVDAEGNAKTVYYMTDEKNKDSIVEVTLSGMNRLYSSNLTIRFVKGEIEGIAYRDRPDGAMYPMDQIVATEKEVTGFNWQPILRPKSWEEMILD